MTTTTNSVSTLMNASTNVSAAVKGDESSKVSKTSSSSASSEGQDDFDDTFNKVQEKKQSTADKKCIKAKGATNAQGAEQVKAKDGSSIKQPQADDKPQADNSPASAAVASLAVDIAASFSPLAKQASKAVGKPASQGSISLDTLLPQDQKTAEQAKANQQLLNMLTGKGLSVAMKGDQTQPNSLDDVVEVTQPLMEASAEGSLKSLLSATVGNGLESSGDTVNDALQSLDAAVGTGSDKSAGVVLQASSAALPIQAVADKALTAAGPQQRALPLQTEVQQTGDKPSVASHNLLQGINLTVENQVSGPAGQAAHQGAGQHSQPQQQSQNFDASLLESMPQLPEEAAADRAPKFQDTLSGVSDNSVLSAQPSAVQQAADNIGDSSMVQQTTAPARTDYDVPQQIIDQAKLIKTTEDTQMVIKLKPEHLGELTLKVSVTENGAVNASFHSDNAQVRGIIESSMVQLKQELQAQGLKVDNVGVYAGLGDSSLLDQGMQQGNNAYAQGKSVKSHDADLDSFEDEAEAFSTAASSIDGVSAADGVDYRV